jgi:hypothetical protein
LKSTGEHFTALLAEGLFEIDVKTEAQQRVSVATAEAASIHPGRARNRCCGRELAPLEFGEAGEDRHHLLCAEWSIFAHLDGRFPPTEPISTGIANGRCGA